MIRFAECETPTIDTSKMGWKGQNVSDQRQRLASVHKEDEIFLCLPYNVSHNKTLCRHNHVNNNTSMLCKTLTTW